MPTPVSALIHAATMVTAGVYLLMRTSPLIEYSSTVLLLCLWIGAITTVFSSVIGLFQQDIKKVIAYSTMSQLAQEFLFLNQTICAEVIYILFILTNSQITKAHDYLCNHNSNLFSLFLKWKIIIISKWVGISEAIRLILIFIKLKIFNLIYILFLSLIIWSILNINFIALLYKNIFYLSNNNHSISEIYTSNTNNKNLNNKTCLNFNQWLAGLIDGDGYFILTKKGYVSFEVTMDIRDKYALYEIMHKFGGSIKPISGANALRYKIRHKKGVICLICITFIKKKFFPFCLYKL